MNTFVKTNTILRLTTFICLIIVANTFIANAQGDGYLVSFSDKNHSEYSLDKPLAFLSARAIERRVKQNIAITQEDLPVSSYYTDSLKRLGISVKHTSKWLNAAIVFSSDQELMDTLSRVSFITSLEKTKAPTTASSSIKKDPIISDVLKSEAVNDYGAAWTQISTINGHKLHEKDLKGKDIHIAVIDAGFDSADQLPSLLHLWDNNQILGTKDFVDPNSNIFNENDHGMMVLSIMGGHIPGTYMGTAPDASYWLIRSEDAGSETPIEADYWVCAAEFADSAGVDIINSSLGYYKFDAPFNSYTYADMIGTTRASHAASIAASKGMLVVVSAGNEGSSSWKYIGAPADASNILSIGAMQSDSTRASFSSYGPTFDQRLKPELTALGYKTAVQSTNGGIRLGNGTSFSAPVVAGMAACLWQALPEYTSNEIMDIIIASCHNVLKPDYSLGNGVPDFNLALKTDIPFIETQDKTWRVSPNPFKGKLTIQNMNTSALNGAVRVSLYDLVGKLKISKAYENKNCFELDQLSHLPSGLYLLLIENGNDRQHFKVMKQ
ncbi:S8 family serine peptidase [Carboxylicivirga sp. N1Y90]|uniref:S8 family serine peptidase n=1 Tax=Carboxylicivirga fragile TaxID=3417571 RepID=UPI003D350FB0|nr:S8 family serine peptidase [Marinilabiliaceae bacterium N1Y90]